MSRNDTYLSLCLEQASLSPLHFRHGCIVVRGGKVIGKGYNDYRSGYNGGAETTGQLSSAVYSQGVITNKSKQKNSKSPYPLAGSGHEVSSKSKSTKNYVAFDSQNHALGTGGGSLANTPLSMHSEMMAINSALSLSSAIACQGTARSTQWLQKPCFKLPGRSKRQTRLQHLKAYADAVCADEQEQKTTSVRRGKAHVQQSRFEHSAVQSFAALSGGLLQRGEGEGGGEERVETSEHSSQQCPPPRPDQLSQLSESQIRDIDAAYERQQRETPQRVPVRHSEQYSVSSSQRSQESTECDTPATTATKN